MALQPRVRELTSLGLCFLNLVKGGSGGGGSGLGVLSQDDSCRDGANPGMGKHSINGTFRFRQFPSARHSLSFQRQASVLALNGRPSEDGNSGLCKLYKDFLSPANSRGTVQNQQIPPQRMRCRDSGSGSPVPTGKDALRLPGT